MSTTLSDDQETSEPASDGEAVSVDRATVTITGLVVTDRTLAELVAHAGTPEERIRMIERALEIGARGIASMGIGIDVAEIDLRVLRTVERVTTEAEQLARRMLDDAQQAFTRSLDPEHRSSVVARSMAEFSAWRDTFLGQVDPDSSDSHIGRLLAHLSSLL
ncbi:MAG: hypothetical protein OEW91_08255, partial [Acidimicrobiia bacterium]|nr:hypothetical protein [Acidimicrobiia bacterium]